MQGEITFEEGRDVKAHILLPLGISKHGRE
jgi:hypothetical protein